MVDATSVIPSSLASISLTKNTLNKSNKSNPRPKPRHPPTAEMVNAAIFALKDRHGTSLQAIKKYINTNYQLDAIKMAPFVKRYIKSAVSDGKLVQTRGKGASGSFKLPPEMKGNASKTSLRSNDSKKIPKVSLNRSNKISGDNKLAKKSIAKMESSQSLGATKKIRQIKSERKIDKQDKKIGSKNNHNNNGLDKKAKFEVNKKNINKVASKLKNVNKNKKSLIELKNSPKK